MYQPAAVSALVADRARRDHEIADTWRRLHAHEDEVPNPVAASAVPGRRFNVGRLVVGLRSHLARQMA